MDRLYEFEKLPENIRQIGEQEENGRIYFEDYVITYMKQIYEKKTEHAIVIFLGKKGTEECADIYFIYGAVELEFRIAETAQFISADSFKKLHETMHEFFPESMILGWGIGLNMENAVLKDKIRNIQKKHFPEPWQICFVSDQSEEIQTLYHFNEFDLEEISGYTVYYGKNPQMQNYMLRGGQRESIEASYTDTVMKNVRAAVKKNVGEKGGKKAITAAGAMLILLTVIGAGILFQSSQKIEEIKQTIAVVSHVERAGNDDVKKTPFLTEQSPAPLKTAAAIFEVTSMPQRTSEVQMTKTTPVVHKQKEEHTKKKAKKVTKKKKQASKKTSALQQSSYVVQPGDTLSQIVWRQYHDMSKLIMVKEKNHIVDENKIREGQRIILPAS